MDQNLGIPYSPHLNQSPLNMYPSPTDRLSNHSTQSNASPNQPTAKKRKTAKSNSDGAPPMMMLDGLIQNGGPSGTSVGQGQYLQAAGNTDEGQPPGPRKRPQSCDVCRARKVKCVKSAGQPRCEGCVSLDQRCEYTHERKKPGPANKFDNTQNGIQKAVSNPKKSPPNRPRMAQSTSSNHLIPAPPLNPYPPHPNFPAPHHVRSYSHGATPTINFDMPPPRWGGPPPPIQGQPPPPEIPFNHMAESIQPYIPPSAAAIASAGGWVPDPSFLPISPHLLHALPGEMDSAEGDDSPMSRWPWMPGLEDLWDPRPDYLDTSSSHLNNNNNNNNNGGGGGGVNTIMAGMLNTQSTSDVITDTIKSINSGNNNKEDPFSTVFIPPARPHSNPESRYDQANSANTQMNESNNSNMLDLNIQGNQNQQGTVSVPSYASKRMSIRMSAAGLPAKVTRIEDVAPLSTITRILHSYYAHLYALMPIVHWPTFSQQLVAREDERSEAWRAFLLSLVAYSIIQLPRSALAFLPVRELRRLHQRCYAESRRLQSRTYREVKIVDIATLYCDHIYVGTLGRTHLANVMLAEAIRLAQTMNLHDERLGDPVLDVIERETRRRVFWLLYGSDRTITALTSVPMHIQDCDLCLPLPLAIDDALLTSAGAFPQPANAIPLLAGFHFNCRLYRLLGAVQTAHRLLTASSAHPQTDPFPMLQLPIAPMYVRPSREFMEELDRMLSDLPGPLQLVNPTNTPGTGQTNSSSSQHGSGMEQISKDSGFATCRANLLISQAMIRFAIRQYAKAAGEEESEGRDWAERDVLQLLESMSSESLAANGESLRRKVLFVASSLLEKYPSSAEGHSYVADFLAVYTRISEEQHAALLEESAAPSREVSPSRKLAG